MKILGFGDYLMHFSPHGREKFMQANDMHLTFTGAEANVTSALAEWGFDTRFVSALPRHAIAEHAVSSLRAFGIDTSFLLRRAGRMGIYFLENGVSLRSSEVIYDRENSVFTASKPEDYQIDEMLEGVDILVLSGITPALSPTLFDTSLALLRSAKEKGIHVVFDVNHRPALLSQEKASENLRALAPYITTLVANEEHLKMLLGVESVFGEEEREARLLDIAERAAKTLGLSRVAVTVRRTLSASQARIYAGYKNGEDFAVSPIHNIDVVDRVGSGDAFTAGLVYSIVKELTTENAVAFASAASAYKHTVESDVLFALPTDIAAVMANARTDVKR